MCRGFYVIGFYVIGFYVMGNALRRPGGSRSSVIESAQ